MQLIEEIATTALHPAMLRWRAAHKGSERPAKPFIHCLHIGMVKDFSTRDATSRLA
jgi:hypothetical protein